MAEGETIMNGASVPAASSVSTLSPTPTPTPPPDTPLKMKGRHRLLRGIQRISSSPSLDGLRRSRSVGSPYRTKASLSCVSLAATGPPHASRQDQLSTPFHSPLSLASTSSALNVDKNEFPFDVTVEGGPLPIRRIESGSPLATPTTSSIPGDVRAIKKKPPFYFWNTMPYELQIQIFSYLQPKELIQTSRVSRAFYKLCFDGQLWTSLDASEYYNEIPAESLARIIVAAGPFIKDLNLRGCVQVEHYKRTEAIVKACKNLITATLEGCQNFEKNTLHTLLNTNENLVCLDLTGLTAVTNASCKVIAQSCRHLERLTISWCRRVDARGVKSVIEGCPRLKDLRVGEVGGFDSLDTAQAIFNTNNLERLVMRRCAELTDEALGVMVHGFDPEIDILTDIPVVPPRKWRHLDLSRCPRITDAGVRALGHHVPNLEGLQLAGCTSLTDRSLGIIVASTPRLTHLELEDLENLTNTFLSEHLAKAPCSSNLEHLSLSNCEDIGDSGVLPVMQKCSNLRSIDLDNTRISDFVLAEAAAMVNKRSRRSLTGDVCPKVTLQMTVYDCQNVTWTGIREVLFRNAQIRSVSGRANYPTEIIGLKCFYGYQMTVNEHQKRVLRNDLASAGKLERKWADYMQASEEAGVGGSGHRRRRRRAREAQTLHMNEEDGTIGINGRRRARTLGSCTVM